MSDQEKKSSIQALAAGLLGFVGVVGLGGALILHHGGASVEPSASYPPVDADSGLRAPVRAAPGSPAEVSPGPASSSPAPLLSDDARDEGSASAASAATAGSPASAGMTSAAVGSTSSAAKLVADSTLGGEGSASSSASASVSTAAVAAAAKAKNSTGNAFLAPKLDLSKNQGTIASTVHYGVSDRHELMGRAAGPVYNFSGRSGQSQGGQVAADNTAAAGAIRQIDAAEKEIDSSGVAASDKAKIDQTLNQVRQDAASEGAGQ